MANDEVNDQKISNLLTEIRMANEVAFQNQLHQNLLAAGSALNECILNNKEVDGEKLIKYMKELKNLFT